jgi:hypothetical protein
MITKDKQIEQFKIIRQTHAAEGLPVVIGKNNRILYLYIDDIIFDITDLSSEEKERIMEENRFRKL